MPVSGLVIPPSSWGFLPSVLVLEPALGSVLVLEPALESVLVLEPELGSLLVLGPLLGSLGTPPSGNSGWPLSLSIRRWHRCWKPLTSA
jgi:hypothetical protein